MSSPMEPTSVVGYHDRPFPNGLRLVVLTMPHLHTAAMALCIRSGSRHEEPSVNGISHFLEHMVFRGCAAYPDAFALNMAIEQLGSPLEATTFRDGTMYEMQCCPEQIARAIAVLTEVVSHPTYPGIDIERNVLIEEALEDLDEDGALVEIDDVAKSARWWNHPLGQSICGAVETLRTITVDQLEAYRSRHYCGANMTLVVGGAVDVQEVTDVVERTLGRIPRGERAIETAPTCAPRTPFKVANCDGPQADVQMSFLAFPPSDPDYAALTVMEDLLSQGMTSRLQLRICDVLGLAYDVGAGCEGYSDVGLFHFEGTVSHERLGTICEEFAGVANDLRRVPLPRDELAHVLERYRWRQRALIDNVVDLCHWTATEALYSVGPLDMRGALDRVLAVTPDDLLRTARRVFRPETMVVAVVGPVSRRRKRRIAERLAELLGG